MAKGGDCVKQKTFNKVVGTIFAVFTLAHLCRIVWQLSVNLAGWEVPMGVSYVVVFVAGYLAYTAYNLKK